jgi:hypothetical protein
MESEDNDLVGREEEDLSPLMRIRDEKGESVQRESTLKDTGTLEMEAETSSDSESSVTSSSSSSSSSGSSDSESSETEEDELREELSQMKMESTLAEGSSGKEFTEHPSWERHGWLTKE